MGFYPEWLDSYSDRLFLELSGMPARGYFLSYFSLDITTSTQGEALQVKEALNSFHRNNHVLVSRNIAQTAKMGQLQEGADLVLVSISADVPNLR